MDVLYVFAPAAIGLVAATWIAAYCWSRYRQASYLVIGWIAVALVLGQFPLFPENAKIDGAGLIQFATFGALAFTPAVVLILLAFRLESVKQSLARIPTHAFIATQAYRVGGVFLFIAAMRGDLPPELGFVSGVMDMIVALTAIGLSLYLRKKQTGASRLVIAWATFSLLDFGWAVTLKFASFFGILTLTPAPVMLGNPPLLIISLFALPLGIFIGAYVLVRAVNELRADRQEG